MKKLMALLLTLAFLGTTLAACAEKTPTNTGSSDTTTAAADTTEAETFPEPVIPEGTDYGGYEFKILWPKWGLYVDFFFSEAEDGESMNDAIYSRDRKIEEMVNIKFTPIPTGSIDDIYGLVKKSVVAGDNAYDLVLTHCISGLGSMATEQLVYDWNKMPIVDYEKPYWNKSMQETLTVNGVLPYASSSYTIPDPNGILFNKDMITDYNLEIPYDVVNSGKWTWDKLSEMAKAVYADLDGNGKFDQNDQYGFCGELDWQFISIMYSADQYVVRRDETGYPVLDVNNEKMINLVQKIYDLLYTDNRSYTYPYDARNTGKGFLDFSNGTTLFYLLPLQHAKLYRATEVDFGILPFPKYDEVQQKYISNNWTGLMALPSTMPDPELVGVIVELLAAESMRTTIPAYYDIMLNSKIVRDTESSQMLDIIYKDLVFDFGLNYTGFTPILYMIPNLMQQKSTDVVSFYTKNAKAVEKTIEKLYNAMLEYEN